MIECVRKKRKPFIRLVRNIKYIIYDVCSYIYLVNTQDKTNNVYKFPQRVCFFG